MKRSFFIPVLACATALFWLPGCTSIPEDGMTRTSVEPGRPSPLRRMNAALPGAGTGAPVTNGESVTSGAPVIPGAFILSALLARADESPELAAAREAIAREVGVVVQGDFIPNPTLLLETDMMPMDDMGFGNAKNKVILSQRIETAGKAKSRVNKALARKEEAEALYYRQRNGLYAEVAADFYKALYARKKAEVTGRMLAHKTRLFDLAEAMNRSGRLSEQDLIPFEVAVQESEAELKTYEAEVARLHRAIEGRLAIPTGTIRSLDGGDPDWRPADAERAVEEILTRNCELVHLDRKVESARSDLDAQERFAWPDVTVGAGYIRGAEMTEERDDFVKAFVELPFPLIDRNQGNIQGAQASVRQAEAELEAAAHRLMDEWHGDQERWRIISGKRDLYYNRIIPLLEKDLSLKERQLEAGRLPVQRTLETAVKLEQARLTALAQDESLALIRVRMSYLTGGEIN